MGEYEAQQWTVLNVGLWNGAITGARGRLLYRAILRSALDAGIRGGTAWVGIEGGHGRGAFRSVESEVASNELPVMLAFVDHASPIAGWLPELRTLVDAHGLVVSDEASVWLRMLGSGGRAGPPGIRASGAPQCPSRDASRDALGPAGDGTRGAPGGKDAGGEDVPSRGFGGRASPGDGAEQGLMVQVYTVEGRTLQGKPVYQAVAEFLRKRGVLWVSTTRGLTGFGEQRRVHEPQWLLRAHDAPVMVTALDRQDRLESHLPALVQFVGHEGLVVSRRVRWHHP
ncbi:DUF190 domain-containing protein [Alicyclobacillus macrosporangiidus]|jgi:PII-like signaling protein|uniref:PII-like signaling protein n=1 Tax=Alicyclobacillus macrosporangiidus TaxID=392015 RepID=A0A1I7KIY8_9BACL|nr:DUF190 domain-containing protein [Alicyclobacillus macrosporangiidus]SFU97391.1 PII-like signaling protein [Alicyclobacillus macrosporangiidus]